MCITYRIHPESKITEARGHPALSTAQGGKIIMDHLMIDIWQQANNQELNAILANHPSDNEQQATIRAALACLAEAGLLLRSISSPEDRQIQAPPVNEQPISTQPRHNPSPALVSVIIVSYNSQIWLKNCIPSLLKQNYSNLEIIIIDNGSNDQTGEWIRENYAEKTKLIQLNQPKSLAFAINRGIDQANGVYTLLLNPDVVLQSETIAHMVSAAQNEPSCAAVAAKLRFLWAPAFLNGLGNYVGAISWGSDSAL